MQKGYSYRNPKSFRIYGRKGGHADYISIMAIEYKINANGDATFFNYQSSDSGNYNELKPIFSIASGVWEVVREDK